MPASGGIGPEARILSSRVTRVASERGVAAAVAGAESAVALQLLQDRERGSQKLVSHLPYAGMSVLHSWARTAVKSRADGTCLT